MRAYVIVTGGRKFLAKGCTNESLFETPHLAQAMFYISPEEARNDRKLFGKGAIKLVEVLSKRICDDGEPCNNDCGIGDCWREFNVAPSKKSRLSNSWVEK